MPTAADSLRTGITMETDGLDTPGGYRCDTGGNVARLVVPSWSVMQTPIGLGR
jgi:hypothetical protein